MALTTRKVVIIKKPTRLDHLVARFNTVQQVKFYIEHIEGDFADYENEHRNYYAALEILSRNVGKVSRLHLVDWAQVPNYQFGADDVVATIGQDGIIANTLKYLNSQLIIGFNPDKARWDGGLAQFDPGEAAEAIVACFAERIAVKMITKAVVELSDRQSLHAVNDFFVGVANHSSARYKIRFRDSEEFHSSSGIVVSTPLGRSAWMKSILTGASAISDRASGKKLKAKTEAAAGKPAAEGGSWDDDCLYFAVREPFPSVSSKTELVYGKILKAGEFSVESKMGENGLIFSDGVQNDKLNFNYSIRAKFGIAKEKGRLGVRS